MNYDYIVPVYVMIDDVLRLMNYQDDGRVAISEAEVLTAAAKFFQSHHEHALCILQRLGDIPQPVGENGRSAAPCSYESWFHVEVAVFAHRFDFCSCSLAIKVAPFR